MSKNPKDYETGEETREVVHRGDDVAISENVLIYFLKISWGANKTCL